VVDGGGRVVVAVLAGGDVLVVDDGTVVDVMEGGAVVDVVDAGTVVEVVLVDGGAVVVVVEGWWADRGGAVVVVVGCNGGVDGFAAHGLAGGVRGLLCPEELLSWEGREEPEPGEPEELEEPEG
jgi:hypothetical protein